jgi:hypothetical protein
MTPLRLVYSYRYFLRSGASIFMMLPCSHPEDWGMKILSDVSKDGQPTRCHIPEDFNLHQHCCESLESSTYWRSMRKCDLCDFYVCCNLEYAIYVTTCKMLLVFPFFPPDEINLFRSLTVCICETCFIILDLTRMLLTHPNIRYRICIFTRLVCTSVASSPRFWTK